MKTIVSLAFIAVNFTLGSIGCAQTLSHTIIDNAHTNKTRQVEALINKNLEEPVLTKLVTGGAQYNDVASAIAFDAYNRINRLSQQNNLYQSYISFSQGNSDETPTKEEYSQLLKDHIPNWNYSLGDELNATSFTSSGTPLSYYQDRIPPNEVLDLFNCQNFSCFPSPNKEYQRDYARAEKTEEYDCQKLADISEQDTRKSESDFRKHCMKSISSITNQTLKQILKERLVILYEPGKDTGITYTENKYFCTGLVISPSTVLTAKHCIVEKSRTPSESKQFISNIEALFPETKRPSLSFSSQNATLMQGEQHDWIVLETSHKVTNLESSLNTMAGEKLPDLVPTNLVIPGYFSILDPNNDGKPMTKITPSSRNFTYMYDPLVSCALFKAFEKNACIAHTCTVEKGMSGAPIFYINEKGPVLIAVHSGGLNDNATCKSSSLQKLIENKNAKNSHKVASPLPPNFGVALSVQVINHINEQ